MSLSHNRITRQPALLKALRWRRSRLMLASIFAVQYAPLAPRASLFLRIAHLRPCQKSPSQKASRPSALKTKSGIPGKPVTFLWKNTPSLRNSAHRTVSHFVFFFVLRAITRLASGDVDMSCRKLGAFDRRWWSEERGLLVTFSDSAKRTAAFPGSRMFRMVAD